MTNWQGEQRSQPRLIRTLRSVPPLQKDLVDKVLGGPEPSQPPVAESAGHQTNADCILTTILDGIILMLLGASLGVIGSLIVYSWRVSVWSLLVVPLS